MREYAGPSHAASYAPPRAHVPEPAPRTPAEHAHDAIARASREVESVASAVAAVRRAHADNDPVRWQEQREVVGLSAITIILLVVVVLWWVGSSKRAAAVGAAAAAADSISEAVDALQELMVAQWLERCVGSGNLSCTGTCQQ